MHDVITFGDIGTELQQSIFSWQFLQFLILLVFALGFVLTSAAVLVLVERKIIAWLQDRLGPIHTGPWGLLQSVADVGKLLMKESFRSEESDVLLHYLAPMVFLAPVIGTFAVLAFSPYLSLPGTAIATGLVYYVAMSSIDIVGLVMASWGSNNKYSLIGGLRAIAQMISYELPLLLSLIGVVIVTSVLAGSPGYPGQSGIGTIAFKEIIGFQNTWKDTGNGVLDFLFKGFTPWSWFVLVQPLMLCIYYICGLAETNRPPFDLPEAESELVAGYLTEYSGVRFALFFLAEYGNMAVVSAVATSLFLGGWSGPGVGYLTLPTMALGWQILGNLLGIIYFVTKVYLLCCVFVWLRGTLPRLRADQLMQFSWLILIPTTLGNILLTGACYLVINALGLPNLVFLIALGVINWAMLFGFIWLVGRATVATTRRAQAPALRALRRVAPVAPLPKLQEQPLTSGR